MSNKVILVFVGAIIIVGGAIMYFGDKERGARPGTSENNTNAEQADAIANDMRVPESGRASLPELIRLGSNVECDFSYTDPESGGVMHGVMYIADRGDTFRGDFTMTQDGQTFETHMIREGNMGYTWSQTPFGSMAVSFEMEGEESFFDSTENDSVNYNQEFEYSCERWRVDNSLFVPPSDIEFTDMTQMMMNMEAGAQTDSKAMQCAACENIADANAKAQCKAAVGCS